MNEQDAKQTPNPIWSTPKIEEFDINDITRGKAGNPSEITLHLGPS